MKRDQHVFLDKITDDFENWSYHVRNYVTRLNLRKTFCTPQEPHFQSDNHETLSEHFP